MRDCSELSILSDCVFLKLLSGNVHFMLLFFCFVFSDLNYSMCLSHAPYKWETGIIIISGMKTQ